MPAIRKPLGEITPEDLGKLITDGWAEDELLEFKQTLPSKRAEGDPWLRDQSSIGNYAKREILSEVVGMANSYGGDVILGMRESEELPHRAIEVTSLPNCEDLSRRFEMFARDHINPKIPLLAVRAIPTEGTAGVIVFRVPASPQAPHRLEIRDTSNDCYKRTRERTEVMSMREIQDLTLERERGLTHVNVRLSELHATYLDFCNVEARIRTAIGFLAYSVRAVPTARVAVSQLHGVAELLPCNEPTRFRFAEGREVSSRAIPQLELTRFCGHVMFTNGLPTVSWTPPGYDLSAGGVV